MIKVLFDTSVIVAGLWLEHPEHQEHKEIELMQQEEVLKIMLVLYIQ